MSTAKKLTLCADDYGLAPGVNDGICQLVKNGRINAVSCMTSTSFWKQDAKKLNTISKHIEVGLHLTLTEQISITSMASIAPNYQLPSLSKLIRLSLSGQIDSEEVLLELQQQYNSFVKNFGRQPDFIDGHHHVHQLPIIRDAVINLIKINWSGKLPWIRVAWESPIRLILRRESIIRAIGIGFFGLGLKFRARSNGIQYNHGFTGVYNYNKETLNDALMDKFLTKAS